MQFNELLEQYSIKEISQRTRVAPENIEHLQGGDWEMMRKVQALGFINIIEREFGVDLSGLRKECLEYYREHEQSLGGEKYELHNNSTPLLSNILSKVAIFIFIALALGGSWYAFIHKNPDLNIEKNAKNAKEGFYDSAMKVAKDIIHENKDNANDELSLSSNKNSEAKDKQTTSESKKDNAENKKSVESGSEEDKKIKLEYAQKPKEDKETKTTENQETNKKDDTTKTLKITDVIPASTTVAKNSDKDTQEQESNNKENTTNKDDNSNDSNDSVVDNNIEVVSLLPEVPSLSKKRDDKKAKTTENTQEKKATNGAAVVILTPRSKVWIGFRELRSGKRTAEVVQKDQAVKFDTTKSDYILATGHGVLTFTNGDEKELLKLHDGKKHFFMIAKGGVREISHEKFQKLNGSKVW